LVEAFARRASRRRMVRQRSDLGMDQAAGAEELLP